MVRKKGVVTKLQNYGHKHPYVSLGLGATFAYYFYEGIIKPSMAPKGPNMYSKPSGIGMTTSTSTTSSSSHGVPGMADGSTGEMSMNIDPTKSGMFGVKQNPQSFLKYDKTKQLSGFSPSARRRVGHASGSSNLGYSPTLDTQFENREAMMMGDLAKHSDILGFSGLMPLAGGDWYE